ncbi:hypothetical protein ACFX13_009044 [Malus domestica]
MDMKKISLAIIVIAALISVVLAAGKEHAPKAAAAPKDAAAARAPTATKDAAPGPASGAASATLSVVGSLAGASLLSFFGFYLQ